MQFTAKERDAETGLDYFLARYYSAAQGRFTSVDPAVVTPERLRDPQQLNRYAYVRNNPLRLVDPTGEILRLSGDVSGAQADLCAWVGQDNGSRITVSDNGTVSFDTTGLDLSANEAATLLSELVSSDNTYGYAVSTTEHTAAGPQPMGTRVESNLDNRPDNRFAKGKRPQGPPPKGVDDQVTLNPTRQYADTQGRPVLRSSVAFHELAEAYSKVDRGQQYVDSLVVINGAVLAGFLDPGAHNQAVLRETKLRDQRPSLRDPGRAGDEVHQIVRDPH